MFYTPINKYLMGEGLGWGEVHGRSLKLEILNLPRLTSDNKFMPLRGNNHPNPSCFARNGSLIFLISGEKQKHIHQQYTGTL